MYSNRKTSSALSQAAGHRDTVQAKEKEEEMLQKKSHEEEEPAQRKALFDNTHIPPPVQRMENKTGMPDSLKSNIESLSGHSMDDVKVHYNSDKPAQMQAHAYAQGTDIHIASGQEKHLPHEAWHVVQQKQGRVQATTQLKSMGVPVNDDPALEKEADTMGAKAAQMKQEEKG